MEMVEGRGEGCVPCASAEFSRDTRRAQPVECTTAKLPPWVLPLAQHRLYGSHEVSALDKLTTQTTTAFCL